MTSKRIIKNMRVPYYAFENKSFNSMKIHKVVSVPRSFIKRMLGVLNKETQELVNEKLKRLFEL